MRMPGNDDDDDDNGDDGSDFGGGGGDNRNSDASDDTHATSDNTSKLCSDTFMTVPSTFNTDRSVMDGAIRQRKLVVNNSLVEIGCLTGICDGE